MVQRTIMAIVLVAGAWCAGGCAAFPDRLHQPQYHNPFPQLHKVAVLPFYNQSREPTVDGDQIAILYYNELQSIPGFEVMPVGVARQLLNASGIEPRGPADFQKLARMLGVDAVVVGSVTEYVPYYPPRIGIAVDWYAANPGFHPIPAGYGLPWGTPEEEFIPDSLVQEAEFALAREQLKTQTPDADGYVDEVPATPTAHRQAAHRQASLRQPAATSPAPPEELPAAARSSGATVLSAAATNVSDLPADWPDPKGFVPPPPRAHKPLLTPHRGPIISHTRVYNGHDGDVTQRLASYHYFRDDARFGGWQSYLQRPEDFARFCCHLHLTETLAARGGAGESRVVWRWPINRYER